MKRLFLVAGILFLFLAGTPPAYASAEDQVNEALTVAEAWAKQIDAGNYDDSYTFACDALKDKVTLDRWDLILRSLRGQWGTVVSRKEISHVYKPDGMQGTSGEFMVITYDTSFAKLDPATEVIVLKWEDGKWRGAGYNAGAKATDDNSTTPEPSTTEIQTQEHVRPQPQ